MQEIDLSYNMIDGPIPETLFGPTTIVTPPAHTRSRSLNCHACALLLLQNSVRDCSSGMQGPFAPADSLKVFNLRYNKISGNIPERIRSQNPGLTPVVATL